MADISARKTITKSSALKEAKSIIKSRPLDMESIDNLLKSPFDEVRGAAEKYLRERNIEFERLNNMLEYESRFWANGSMYIAGIDEAGRGPLAGPVVAAAVVLPSDLINNPELLHFWGLNDSKKLSSVKRKALVEMIHKYSLCYALGWQNQRQIDKINILEATRIAMIKAVDALCYTPVHLLIDGNPVHDMPIDQTAIVGGDSKSLSIAAASILAKCFRDDLMERLDSRFPQYGFAVHKGYGTAAHIAAMREYGPCILHRDTFMPKSLGGRKDDRRS